MTEALESSGIELDRRRRFTEAILESIPTGVISIASDGSIQHVNRALAQDLSWRTSRTRHPPGRPLLPRRHDRTQIPHEARAPHRRGIPATGAAHRQPQDPPGRDSGRARIQTDLGLRRGPRRHQRAAARAKGRGVARGGPPRGARDQEPAHADRAFRRAHRPPARPPRTAAGHRPHRLRVRRHHHEIGGVREDAGGRVFAVRALSLGAARAQRPQ